MPSKKWIVFGAAGVVIAATIILNAGGQDMGLTSKRVLFSRVEGLITKDGTPVEGAEIKQTVLYKEKDRVPSTTVSSDEHGMFTFDEVSVTEGPKLLPGEVTVGQSLVITYEGQTYEAWHHGKKGKEANAEAGGKPMRLICELRDEPGVRGSYYGVCRLQE